MEQGWGCSGQEGCRRGLRWRRGGGAELGGEAGCVGSASDCPLYETTVTGWQCDSRLSVVIGAAAPAIGASAVYGGQSTGCSRRTEGAQSSGASAVYGGQSTGCSRRTEGAQSTRLSCARAGQQAVAAAGSEWQKVLAAERLIGSSAWGGPGPWDAPCESQ